MIRYQKTASRRLRRVFSNWVGPWAKTSEAITAGRGQLCLEIIVFRGHRLLWSPAYDHAAMARFKSRAPVRPAASSPSSSTSKLATMDPPDAATGFIALTAVLVWGLFHDEAICHTR